LKHDISLTFSWKSANGVNLKQSLYHSIPVSCTIYRPQ